MGMTSSLRCGKSNGKSKYHYESPEGHPGGPYPPPACIDFASGDLRPPSPPTRLSPLIFHCQWLGGPHDGYPLATTLDEYFQLRQTGSAPGTLEHAALIQSELTFGLIESVLRIKIPASFLLEQAADGTTTLSTAKLPILCRDLYHRVRVRHHAEKCRSWLENTALTLSTTYRWLEVHDRDKSTNPFLAAGLLRKAYEDIHRTVCMIGYSLFCALRRSPSECNPIQAIPDIAFQQLPDIKPAEHWLRAQGWCPLTIAALGTRGFVLPEYARSIHPFLRITGEHSRCTEVVCAVNTMDPTTYIQQHFPTGCDCAPTIPPLHDVESILYSGRIPVVIPSDRGISVRAAEDYAHVAISHVWIDGLGSTTEEGLPACQISRLASMASSLVPSGAFWVDALCVPNRKDLRKRAIQLMAKTYTDADAVLVIDAGIRSCSKNAPLEEKLFRIYTSGWMQRLWTYQEAMLAKRLYFEFADGLVKLEDLMPSHEERTVNPLFHSLVTTLWNMKVHISGDRPMKNLITLREVMEAVRWRTTSKLEDETLAISGLLQIDVCKLLNASSPDERMMALLLQQQKIPRAIIFHSAPKISGIPGFSWAPRSFMTGAHPRAKTGREPATCTRAGLLAEYASLIFSEPMELDENMRYVIRNSTGPAFTGSFLLRPVKLVRDHRRESCNAILMRGKSSIIKGSVWQCVGVRMADEKEGTLCEKEPVCRYRDIHFNLGVIDVSEASREQAEGTPVIEAKWGGRMMVRVV